VPAEEKHLPEKSPGLLQQVRYNNAKLNTWLENLTDFISFSRCLCFLLDGLEYFFCQIFLSSNFCLSVVNKLSVIFSYPPELCYWSLKIHRPSQIYVC